jgi:hypothetical protein
MIGFAQRAAFKGRRRARPADLELIEESPG